MKAASRIDPCKGVLYTCTWKLDWLQRRHTMCDLLWRMPLEVVPFVILGESLGGGYYCFSDGSTEAAAPGHADIDPERI